MSCHTDAKILLIESDRMHALVLKNFFAQRKYTNVSIVLDGISGLKILQKSTYSLVLLNIQLAKIDGLSVVEKIRKTSHHIPIIAMGKNVDVDQILSYSYCANLFHSLPINFDLLEAQIYSLIHDKKPFRTCTVAEYVLDINSRSLLRKGVPICLTASEYCFVERLFSEGSHLIPKEQVKYMISKEFTRDNEYAHVDTFMSRLRKKLHPEMIETLHGYGYKLNKAFVSSIKDINM